MRLFAAFGLLASTASAQQFDTVAWNKPAEPFRIIGPIHYVGTQELAAFLITTPAGDILIDGGLPESAALIEKSIRALGQRPENIKLLLTTQAHFDHVGSLSRFKKLSGARACVMDADVALVESGGKTDYLFGKRDELHFEPVKVDRTLHDGDTVSLGGVILTARKTPGHTPGTTTWLTSVEDGARRYSVVFAGSTTINPGTRLLPPASYAGIDKDFAHAFEVLESLQPEIFLAAHAGIFQMEEKRARLSQPGPNPFLDPDGYREHIRSKKKAFEEELARERRTP